MTVLIVLLVSANFINQITLTHKMSNKGAEVNQAPQDVASKPATNADPDALGLSFHG